MGETTTTTEEILHLKQRVALLESAVLLLESMALGVRSGGHRIQVTHVKAVREAAECDLRTALRALQVVSVHGTSGGGIEAAVNFIKTGRV